MIAGAQGEACARFTGCFTSLVTPFRDGELDELAVAALAERQIAAGIAGLVVASGAAGEEPTLRPDERRRLIARCIDVSAGRVPVIAGASSNSTATAVALIREAQGLGADGVHVTAPWYNRPSQEGVFRHYLAASEAATIPLVVGNSPGRTRLDISVETLRRLGQVPGIVGLEDASGDVTRLNAIAEACPAWVLLSGHDPSSLGHLAYGGHGAISLTANVAPDATCALHAACGAEDWGAAQRLQRGLFQLQAAVSNDPAPAVAKLALSILGLCRPDVRAPITEATSLLQKMDLVRAMEACGVEAAWR